MASYFDEDDDNYFVEFEADEDKFVAEREFQSSLKAQQYRFHKEQDRSPYDTDDEASVAEQDCAPYFLHRNRMRFCPRPDSGAIYDVTAAPPWKFLFHLPRAASSINPLSEDVKALDSLARAVFAYCEQEDGEDLADMEV